MLMTSCQMCGKECSQINYAVLFCLPPPPRPTKSLRNIHKTLYSNASHQYGKGLWYSQSQVFLTEKGKKNLQ